METITDNTQLALMVPTVRAGGGLDGAHGEGRGGP